MITIRHSLWGPATLVTGGTGTTGSRVAERLWDRGGTVRLGHRGGLPPFDWADARSWGPALDGAHAVYLAYQPDIAAPEAAGRVGAFARAAVARGARRLVLLSSLRAPGARRAEDALRASGAEWTILRASAFMQNLTEGARALVAASPALAAGAAREPFVDAADVAEVAATALLEGGLGGRVLTLTGPRALTWREALVEVAAVAASPAAPGGGRAGDEAAGAGLAPLPGPLAALLDGPSLPATTAVADLLGRPARDLRRVAAEARAADAGPQATPPRYRRQAREET